MSNGQNPIHGVTAELLPDHLQLFVEAAGADRAFRLALLHEGHEARACSGRIAFCAEAHDLGGHQGLLRIRSKAQILQAQKLTLVHRDAALHLAEILAKPDLQEQLLDLAELAFFLEAAGPILHLAQAFHICGQPCQAVGCCLVLLNQAGRNAAIAFHKAAHLCLGGLQQGLQGGNRCGRQIGEVRKNGRWGCRKVLSVVGHGRAPLHTFIAIGPQVCRRPIFRLARSTAFATAAQQKFAAPRRIEQK